MSESPRASWPWVQAAAVLLVFALFLWSVGEALNPLLLFLALLALLVPYRGLPGRTLLLGVAGVLTVLWVLTTTGSLLAPFVVALGIAYLLDPLVDRLEGRGVHRALAIGLLALPVAGLLAVGVFVGLPALGQQVAELIDRAPVLLERVARWIGGLREHLRGMPLVGDELLGRLDDIDADAVVAFLEDRRAELANRAWEGVLGLGRGIGSVFTVLGYVVLTPVLAFYLLRDWDRLTEGLAGLLPLDRRAAITSFAREYDRLLARYMRGQITVALTIGLITALGLWVARFPYPFLVGVAVAVFSVVPYLGLVLSLIPAVLIALMSGDVGLSLLKLAVVFGIAQGLEGAVVSPRIVGESVGLHPVWVVLALAAGGFYFGFVGLLLAVPGAVGIKLLVIRGVARWRASDTFRGEASDGHRAPDGAAAPERSGPSGG
jgi:predicted PurR-regulated permease PerM